MVLFRVSWRLFSHNWLFFSDTPSDTWCITDGAGVTNVLIYIYRSKLIKEYWKNPLSIKACRSILLIHWIQSIYWMQCVCMLIQYTYIWRQLMWPFSLTYLFEYLYIFFKTHKLPKVTLERLEQDPTRCQSRVDGCNAWMKTSYICLISVCHT